MQSQQSVDKWNSQARIGIYLRMPPKHFRSVALVLNPRTGLVSPQFYVKFDSAFTTVSSSEPDTSHGMWKSLSRFRHSTLTSQHHKMSVKPQKAPQPKEPRMQPPEGVQLPNINLTEVLEGDEQITNLK